MGMIKVPAEWFYIICCLLFSLIGTVVFLCYLLHKMKSKLYKEFKESNRFTITDRTRNTFKIPLQDRKESDRLLRIYANFKYADPELQQTNYSDAGNIATPSNAVQSKDQVDNVKRDIMIPTVLPPLMVREQMEKLCNELLNSRKKITQDNQENSEEAYELRNINRKKSKIRSFRASNRVRSKSTTDLDIYDTLPEPLRVVKINTDAEDEDKYSSLRNGEVVIINDESGYMLPLTLKIPYANVNTK